MSRLKPYMIGLMVAVLMAGPWLQVVQAKSPQVEVECSCCGGPCTGCCCSPADDVTPNSETEKSTSCHCDLTALPAPVDVPVESTLPQNLQDLPGLVEVTLVDVTVASIPEVASDQDMSPPRHSPPPAFLLFGVFLS